MERDQEEAHQTPSAFPGRTIVWPTYRLQSCFDSMHYRSGSVRLIYRFHVDFTRNEGKKGAESKHIYLNTT